jgi:histidinol dehydrogenase
MSGATTASGPSIAPTKLTLRRLDLRTLPLDGAVAAERAALVRRSAVPDDRVRSVARTVIAEVRSGGDAAVRAANERFGGGLPDGRLVLGPAELDGAADGLAPAVRTALQEAIANVRAFAEVQRPVTMVTTTVPGVTIERRWVPLDRVGCYVPGGLAPLPSSLVMTVVPARVAGVREVVVATPADRDGRPDPTILGAAGLLGVDTVVVAGGVQAIAALAFGLPGSGLAPVDRIVGPGSAFVTAAKLELAGEVGIDLPAGPSEGMVIADETADPRFVAADLITQAEHGPDSPAILVTTSPALAAAVEREIGDLLERQPRRAILERSLGGHGRVVLVPDLEAAIAFADEYAPEHLSIETADDEAVATRIRNAGSVFVGPWAPESAGDYATGANHVLPTGGLARSSGALSVESFGKAIQVQRIDRAGLDRLRPTISALASAEGLAAHRGAVEVRFEPAADAGRAATDVGRAALDDPQGVAT